MKSIIIGLITFATIAAAKDEKPLKLADLPAPVQKTIQQHASADQIRSIEREEENGKVVYDVEFTKAGKKGEMDVAEDGKLLGTEEEIAQKNLPAAVQKTLAAQAGKVGTVMKVLEDGKTSYEIELHQGDNVREVVVDPNGKILEGGDAGQKKD